MGEGVSRRHAYFAYGSNVQRATFLGRRGLSPFSSAVGRLEGWELCFDIPVGPAERGVANLRRREGAEVWGVLWEIGSEDFERLDRSEGVPGGLYRHEPVEILTVDGARRDAVTYVSEHRGPGRKPSSRYLSIILDGARDCAIPGSWIETLERFEIAWDEREGAENPPGLGPPPGYKGQA